MASILDMVSRFLLAVATCVLMALAAVLIGYASWVIAKPIWANEDPTSAVVDAISLIIIAFAVMALSKFIAEEEIERKRELASAGEARRSLTKFITIIIIALSLEALVMAFEAARGDITSAIYPIALFAVAVLALVGLGAYQWLSNEVERALRAEPARDEEPRHRT